MTFSNVDFGPAPTLSSFEALVAEIKRRIESPVDLRWTIPLTNIVPPRMYQWMQIETGPGTYAEKQVKREAIRYAARLALVVELKAQGKDWLRRYMRARGWQ